LRINPVIIPYGDRANQQFSLVDMIDDT